jgi:glutathione peroxidase-family protein
MSEIHRDEDRLFNEFVRTHRRHIEEVHAIAQRQYGDDHSPGDKAAVNERLILEFYAWLQRQPGTNYDACTRLLARLQASRQHN